MLHIRPADGTGHRVSELTLSDQLIALAKEAERAGFRIAAARLVSLACDIFDEVEPLRV